MLLAEEDIFLFNIFINELKKERSKHTNYICSTLVAIANINKDGNNSGKNGQE